MTGGRDTVACLWRGFHSKIDLGLLGRQGKGFLSIEERRVHVELIGFASLDTHRLTHFVPAAVFELPGSPNLLLGRCAKGFRQGPGSVGIAFSFFLPAPLTFVSSFDSRTVA